MPSSAKIIRDHGTRVVVVQETVDLVFLAPDKRLTQHVTRLFHVEIPSAQETQQHSIGRQLALVKLAHALPQQQQPRLLKIGKRSAKKIPVRVQSEPLISQIVPIFLNNITQKLDKDYKQVYYV